MFSVWTASFVEAAWYLECSGVVLEVKEGAVAFKAEAVVPFVWPLSGVAIGAILALIPQFSGMGMFVLFFLFKRGGMI